MRPSTWKSLGYFVVLAILMCCNLKWKMVVPRRDLTTTTIMSSPSIDASGSVTIENDSGHWSEYVKQLEARIQQLEQERIISNQPKVVDNDQEEQRQHHQHKPSLLLQQWSDEKNTEQQHLHKVLQKTVSTWNFTEQSKILLMLLQSIPAHEEDAIWDALHGHEFQYRLTCPDLGDDTKNMLDQTNSSVIIGYHVGMMKNWRLIVRDQIHSLHSCGLGQLATRWFVSYSNNITVNDELDDLKSIFHRYSFAQNVEFLYSAGQPVEGVAINAIHEECQKRYPHQPYPPAVTNNSNNNNATQDTTTTGDTAVFYFHTKGTSRYSPNWQDNMGAKFQYPTSLYWRKYMEYFTLERPQVCIDKIIKHHHFGCGVYWIPRDKFYGGNFWVASGRYLSSLLPLKIYNASEEMYRWTAEGWITSQLRNDGIFPSYARQFVVPSDPPAGLYSYLIRPQIYSDYTKRWAYWFNT